MNLPVNPANNDIQPQPEALAELTIALEKIIQELAIAPPETISVFFDGTEVYRQQTEDGSVFWWETNDNSTQSSINQIALFSSH
jgi:hypothetical protein